MVTLASTSSRYTTRQGSYKQLTLHVAISSKMETVRVSPHRCLQQVGGWRKSWSFGAWNVSEGGGTELFSEQSGCTCHCGYWFKCAEYSETSPVTPLFDAGYSPSFVVPQPLRKYAPFLCVKSVRTEGQLAQSRHNHGFFCPDLAEESRFLALLICQKVEKEKDLDSVDFKAVPHWIGATGGLS